MTLFCWAMSHRLLMLVILLPLIDLRDWRELARATRGL